MQVRGRFDHTTASGAIAKFSSAYWAYYKFSLNQLLLRLFIGIVLAVSLAGCFSAFEQTRGNASIATPPVRAGAGEYLVVGGDTLYSIAFRNQLDYHDIARWNRINPPDYRIYPGRLLRLTPPGSSGLTQVKPDTAAPVSSAVTSTPFLVQKSPGGQVLQASTTAIASTATTTTTAVAPQNQPSVSLPPDSAAPPQLSKRPTEMATSIGSKFDAGRWQWPTAGKVGRGFGVDGNKGIDIAGKLGQAVVSAGPGKVVYSGSALKGYGEMVILKHDEQYLSAYGFNQRRLVKEGDVVAAGQPIAELGIGPEQKPELHFEIRDRGRPVDPTTLLPAR